MSFETVNYELKNSVTVITLNRPDALNALSQQLTRDLRTAVDKVTEDKARAAILTGAGRAFCAGGDLKEMREIGEREGKVEAFLDGPLKALHNIIRAIRKSPVPFVAAVNGVCAGAGVNFALACDIVIADEEATFREAFVRIGLTPDCGGTFFLLCVLDEKPAYEMFMTGDAIPAQRAVEMGMINKVVPAAQLQDEAQKMAAKLAAGPSASIARIKRMMNATFTNDLNAQLEMEAACQLESGRGTDFKEGVDAFFEKRAPSFSGQ